MVVDALESCLVDCNYDIVVPNGYADLDARCGGLHAGELTTIGARPGAGKSAMSLGIALNAANSGKEVTYVSCEKTHQELAQRCLSIETGIPVHGIKRGVLSDSEKF